MYLDSIRAVHAEINDLIDRSTLARQGAARQLTAVTPAKVVKKELGPQIYRHLKTFVSSSIWLLDYGD